MRPSPAPPSFASAAGAITGSSSAEAAAQSMRGPCRLSLMCRDTLWMALRPPYVSTAPSRKHGGCRRSVHLSRRGRFTASMILTSFGCAWRGANLHLWLILVSYCPEMHRIITVPFEQCHSATLQQPELYPPHFLHPLRLHVCLDRQPPRLQASVF